MQMSQNFQCAAASYNLNGALKHQTQESEITVFLCIVYSYPAPSKTGTG